MFALAFILSLHSCPTLAQIDDVLRHDDAGTFADVGTRADVMLDAACVLPGDWVAVAGYADSLAAAYGVPCDVIPGRDGWAICDELEADAREANEDAPPACSDTATDLEDECLAPMLRTPAVLERPASLVIGLSDGLPIETRPATKISFFALDY